jgi:endonuclease/exonuclease/phosphatase family metal-dependent hydrolase
VIVFDPGKYRLSPETPMIRVASYNVENLFARPKAFDGSDWTIGEPILAAYREVNALFQSANYSAADRTQMRNLLLTLDIYYRNAQGAIRRRRTNNPRWAWLRKNRGSFDRQPRDNTRDVEIIATSRADWIGWVELAKEPVNEVRTRLTARVINDVNADIIGVVEAEDRPSLVRFNSEMLNDQYEHIMLIDGNDERGIDVGIMTGANFPIRRIRSNVDRNDNVGEIFSRDCPQYEVRTDSGELLHVLVNHFKSQSGGGGTKRRRQATAVREIVDGLVAAGQHVVVLGDLNEGPRTENQHVSNFARLYEDQSPLIDCYSLPGFDAGPRPGTFDSCGIRNRLDYIFISESIQHAFVSGGIFRTGLWGSRQTRPNAWPTYPDMTRSEEQASDHAAVFIDLDL